MKKITQLLFGFALALAALVWGTGSPWAASGSGSCCTEAGAAVALQIKGSDTMVNLVQAWAEEYIKKYPDEFLAVTGGGSGTGLAALVSGSCNIAMSSRPITPKEVTLAASKNIAPKEYQVALDGLAVVVHPSNSISSLTLDQIADIFTGRVKNWKEFGGRDAAIVLLSREVNSGTHVYFKEHVLRKGNAKGPEEFSSDALLLSSSQAIADEVAQNPDAIGYYGMGYISPKQKALSVSKGAGVEAVLPSIESVQSGLYPISRPLFLYTRAGASDAASKFVDYVLSPEGQAIVATIDFVPLKLKS